MADAGALGLITTALVLGVRHGFDWDHLAAITDVTSTTATADAAELDHEAVHEHAVEHAIEHSHEHGGNAEREAHRQPPVGDVEPHAHAEAAAPIRFLTEQQRALLLGSMYALGHATIVAVLGTLALAFGAVLPSWVDDVMGPVVGATLLFLGVWVFVSLYQYARHGREFQLRSRWMLVFASIRYAWRRLEARLHGHEHVDPIEMSSYGVRTAFGVGLIHGIGAETGTQVLLIAAIGGASSQGLGFPMLFAFIVGLLISNSIVVFITATGFIASRFRQRMYVLIGVLAGTFSLVVGAIFLLGLETHLPPLDRILDQIAQPAVLVLILGSIHLTLLVAAVLDLTNLNRHVREGSRLVWAVVVLLVPIVGPSLYFLAGREAGRP
jgi:high-affinity nickel permease